MCVCLCIQNMLALTVKKSSCNAGDWVQFLGREYPPEKIIATHPSILVWRIPWTEESGRLQSMVLKESDTPVQFSSVESLSGVRLCDLMDCSMPGLPVHHQLPELAQTHVLHFSHAIQPSHSPLSSSPPAFSLSQHQGLFQ